MQRTGSESAWVRRALEPLDGDEMGSKPRRYLCHECQTLYESDASGLLTEIDS